MKTDSVGIPPRPKRCVWRNSRDHQPVRIGEPIGTSLALPGCGERWKTCSPPRGCVYRGRCDNREGRHAGKDLDSDAGDFRFDLGYVRAWRTGCFPGGTSPFGVEEMAGNIWEWTCSLWGVNATLPDFGYPYIIESKRENVTAPPSIHRVIRGGAFSSTIDFTRCAHRRRNIPSYCHDNLGFRVVISP